MQKKSFENTCGECRHFRLHYIKYGRGHYDPLSYGHCIKPRRKKWYTADQGIIRLVIPPSMTRFCPLIKLLAGSQRNITARAMSIGSPTRPDEC